MSDLIPEMSEGSVSAQAASALDGGDEPADSPVPEFGLLDVIEAFTAMRHEYRGQTRETRDLAEAVRYAADRIGQVDAKLAADSAGNAGANESEMAARLVDALVEIDLHLSRAADAAAHYERSRADPENCPRCDLVRDLYQQLNPLARWFCRSFYQRTLQRLDEAAARQRAQGNPTTEGLALLVARVRRLLGDQQIERIETVGKSFDAERMNAIEAVHAVGQSSGHVLEQLSPAYLWQGRLVRYAEVRVVK